MKDPTDTRDIGPRVGSPLWIHLTVVTAVGAAVFGYAMTDLGGLSSLIKTPLFWVLSVMIVLGEVWPVTIPRRASTDAPITSISFSFAALIVWGLPVGVLVWGTSTLVAHFLVQRRAVHRAVFNAAVAALGMAAAGLVLYALGNKVSATHPWTPRGSDLWRIAPAAVACFIVVYVLVVTAVALHSRWPVLPTLIKDLPYEAFVSLVLFATAPLVAVVIHTGSALLLLLFAFPLGAIYINAAVSVQRQHQAHHDELTGLPNRKLLMLRLDSMLAQAASSGGNVGFLLLDLDRGLKEVNDTLGHAVGDRLLRLVAHRLTHSVRPGDLVARLGGDEFAVLLPSVKEASAAREVAARLRAAVAEPIRLEGMSFVIEVSIGIAMFPEDATADELLMQRADVAMYLAKQRRSGVERYVPDLDRNSPARLALFGELRRGLDRGELELHYQPKMYLADNRAAGMEALVRWRHPVRGMLTPDDFIPIVQQSYLMREVTAYVIETALAQVALWRQAGLAVQVSVNVSGRDLLDTGLADLVSRGLNRHQLPPDALLLEIDERVLTREPAHAVATAEALAEIGVGLSLDDFGTGYSNLLRLKRLPICEVKVDQSFVGSLLESPEDEVVVKMILDLAAALGIRSVAEGVESAEVAAALSAMGCVAGQGWYFAKPMPAVTATAWLTEHGTAGDRASQAPAGWEPISRTFDDAITGESGAVRLHDHVLLRGGGVRRDLGAGPCEDRPRHDRHGVDGPAVLVGGATFANGSRINDTVIAGTVIGSTAIDGTVIDGTAIDGTALDGTAVDGTAVDGTPELRTRVVVPPTGWRR
jgi:diguanylate cyclase (GGDEF)-like protein